MSAAALSHSRSGHGAAPSAHRASVRPLDADESLQSPSSVSDGMEKEPPSPEEAECKFNDQELLHTRTPLLYGADAEAKREELRAYFHRTFSLYERLFGLLRSDETFYMQPEKLRHALIFYWGHTAVFFVNKLRLAGLLTHRVNETMESTLAIGVDEMSWDDCNSANYVWPSVADVRAYRDTVRLLVDDLISTMPLSLPIGWSDPAWVVLMGCEHERIHLETSSVLFRQLPVGELKQDDDMFVPCPLRRARVEDVPNNTLLPVPGGEVRQGKSFDDDTYGWDVEYGTAMHSVESFQAARFLVSNAEFLQFVRDGGYEERNRELWGEEGWRFVQYRQARHPVFWVPVYADDEETAGDKDDAATTRTPVTYRYRTITNEIDMPWDWPVDCNYIEAAAFCAWLNRKRAQDGSDADGLVYRLPSEAEWLRLRDHALPDSDGRPVDQPYWKSAPGNLNLEHWSSSCPIDQFQFAHGFCDIIGNVWQWSCTPVAPLRGFKYHPLYDDFSIPTFDTRHNMILGGSFISTGNEATRHARYAFRRHFYQHAGFRYVLAQPLAEDPVSSASHCESDPAVTAMLEAQYNEPAAALVCDALGMNRSVTQYATKLAQVAVKAFERHARGEAREGEVKAIDLGCACGRTTFEMAKLAAEHGSNSGSDQPLFTQLTGLDFSTRFIRLAAQLQTDGHVEYQMRRECELISYHSIESKRNATAADSAPSASDLNIALVPPTAPIFVDLDLQTRGMQSRVEFVQGDVCNLSVKYDDYSLVVAANLLEFLYDPAAFLRLLPSRVRRGGLVLLASTYGWSADHTPREKWLGGLKDRTGENVESARAVEEIMREGGFEPIAYDADLPAQLPMMWKQDARQWQLRIAHGTLWRKI